MAQRKTIQSSNSIQRLKTGGNITTASFWTETPIKGLKVVNIDLANASIGGNEEDDGRSVQVF
jgi:hypothetical protein